MDRDEAQARLDRIRAFAAELEALQRDGVAPLTDDQRGAIAEYHRRLAGELAARFDVDRDEGQRRMSLGMRIASLVGAIALCAAVFLFFYRIWGWLSTPAQVAILVAAPFAGVALTEAAHRLDRGRHFVFVAALIACACFVLNVFMIGRIFAMSDSPNALGVWAAFALAIGYGYGLRLPVAGGLALALVFVVGSLLWWQGGEWTAAWRRPELALPAAIAIGAVGAATAGVGQPHRRFASTFRIVGVAVCLLAVWVLSIEGRASVLPWSEKAIEAMYQVAGFVVSAAVVATGLRRGWSDATNLGAAGFVVFLYTKFFQWWWDWMPAYLFFLIIGATAIAAIVVMSRMRASLKTAAA